MLATALKEHSPGLVDFMRAELQASPDTTLAAHYATQPGQSDTVASEHITTSPAAPVDTATTDNSAAASVTNDSADVATNPAGGSTADLPAQQVVAPVNTPAARVARSSVTVPTADPSTASASTPAVDALAAAPALVSPAASSLTHQPAPDAVAGVRSGSLKGVSATPAAAKADHSLLAAQVCLSSPLHRCSDDFKFAYVMHGPRFSYKVLVLLISKCSGAGCAFFRTVI